MNIQNSFQDFFCIVFCDRLSLSLPLCLFSYTVFSVNILKISHAVSHVLNLTPTFSIKIDERSTRERNAHAMQIVKATSSCCRWPECGLWRQSAVRRPGNGGNGKRAGEEALTREAGIRVRFRFLSLSLSQFVSSGLPAQTYNEWRYSMQKNVDKPGFPGFTEITFCLTCATLTTCYFIISILFDIQNNFLIILQWLGKCIEKWFRRVAFRVKQDYYYYIITFF